MSDLPGAATAATWDAEYAAGRYLRDPPVAFVDDVVAAARRHNVREGLYVGCGNGRNLVPMLAAGLDMTGLDISAVAIAQLRGRLPDRADRLVHGTVGDLPAGRRWPLVVGIQVFQHGDRDATHAHLRAAQLRTAPGGLFAIRVNAVGTDVWPDHQVVEQHADEGFTVRYLTGAKTGELIHFYGAAEVAALFDGWAAIVAPRLDSTPRTRPGVGQWSQWEGIWRAPADTAPADTGNHRGDDAEAG